ncbi:hemerythrin domain-containing protein [Novosphingobium soli]|uniref:Hemerythrin domain-containing protein n=1 Tax=Novosphingobium soli TaxID=574956 RepID=A0ABV6CTF7_9SPHN
MTMSMFDKVIAAITPPETAQQRADAHAKAREAAEPGDWLSLVLDHHEEIGAAFAAVRAACDSASRRVKLRQLGVVLTGHAQAEEAVLYPALATHGEKTHATAGYEEQSVTKVQMAILKDLDPMSQEFEDKLGHIEGAVLHHIYAEEHNWFIDLKQKAPAADQAKLADRYTEEYGRYTGVEAMA